MMNPVECQFEPETLAAVLQSRWPARVDDELRQHVAQCGICADVVAIAGVMDEAREESRSRAVVPDAGRVWRLAQLRAHCEAVEAAGRPITAAQTVAFACAIGLLGACFGATSTWFQSALGRVTSTVTSFRIQPVLLPAMALMAEHGALVLTMAGLVFLVPAIVCLAVLRD
jgi:hypothetical protein